MWLHPLWLTIVLPLASPFSTHTAPAAFISNALSRNVAKNANPATSSALFATLEEPKVTFDSSVKTIESYVADRGGSTAIKKVLIANNGMAATKSILSMRQWAYMELGDERAVQFVAMASPEDIKANAEFVRLADSYVVVPGGSNANNYANVKLITQIAIEQGVDAVWPGWGHASEKPELPTALKANGIKFIGPTAPVMAVLGDKIAANILAQSTEFFVAVFAPNLPSNHNKKMK
jgi:acetyl-CoA carboxylase/biotin carboxylase 1